VERCLEAAVAGQPLTADCRDVVEPDLPAVEVLARLALESARAGRRFGLEHASTTLLDLVRLCGLEAWIRVDPG
jgi:ABC-type transporter Mla MlaB component